MADGDGRVKYKYMAGFSPVQNTDRLPPVFLDMKGRAHDRLNSVYGHNGSHAFLIDDFVRAVLTNKLPPVDPWLASYCTLAGIYAHKSAMMGGVTLTLPDLGEAPADWEHICFDDIHYDESRRVI